ncbi:hypothetical protein SBF1_5840005 [Candidatus Desulfosporosinus infrequens]|uniref:Uncharacterized protein n=1 Tax=Candidatus Desulfosporosinus infrequens TaxID=2043169 RepID=A0A2U3LL41_9FIRM|nr:hypothetical protein SBF1_5840005 [Candidatus Desulfosporosinus infrequens]
MMRLRRVSYKRMRSNYDDVGLDIGRTSVRCKVKYRTNTVKDSNDYRKATGVDIHFALLD